MSGNGRFLGSRAAPALIAHAALMPTTAHPCAFGRLACDFALAGVDGRLHTLADVRGRNGTVIAFICNYCPYVKVIVDRLVEDAQGLHRIGINTIAIMPNDADAYPQDGFANMQAFAQAHGFVFPYVIDKMQIVAHALGAQCTPDFFGFNARDELQYHGRLDASRTTPMPGARRELYEAMDQIAATGDGPIKQMPSVGCSIKWRE